MASLPWHRIIVVRLIVRFVRRGGGDACGGCIGIRRLPMGCTAVAVGVKVDSNPRWCSCPLFRTKRPRLKITFDLSQEPLALERTGVEHSKNLMRVLMMNNCRKLDHSRPNALTSPGIVKESPRIQILQNRSRIGT